MSWDCSKTMQKWTVPAPNYLLFMFARGQKKSALGHARREDRDLDIRKPLQTTRRELRMTEKQFQSKVIRVPQRGKPIYTVIP